MFRPIYEPRTRAKEYCDLAINIYTGCNHGCTYCYARKMHDRFHPNKDFADVKPRENIVVATSRQLAYGNYKDKKIMLCFTCDPYPANIDTTPTREIIQAIKDAGAHVQILTKGGDRARRDFDLLDENDSFGVTLSGFEYKRKTEEPNAAPNYERSDSLLNAYNRGIKTWVSCEPVLDIDKVYQMIIDYDYIDFYRIGKLNYFPSNINWKEFGCRCERLCKELGRNYYIKEDLRKEMDA